MDTPRIELRACEPPTIRAQGYFLAESARRCWRCSRPTRVFAIMLPAGHQVLCPGDDADDPSWEIAEEPTLLSGITHLAGSIPERLHRLAPCYRVDFSAATRSFCWMNHCERCWAKHGDPETLEEFDSPFSPATAEHASAICLREILEPFTARCASYTCGIPLFEVMRRI